MSISFPIPFIQGTQVKLTSLFTGPDLKKRTRTLDAFCATISLPGWIDHKTITDVVGKTLPFKFISDSSAGTVFGEGTARFDEFSCLGDTLFHNLWLVVDCPEFEEEYERGGYGVRDLLIPHEVSTNQYLNVGPVRIIESFRDGAILVHKKGE